MSNSETRPGWLSQEAWRHLGTVLRRLCGEGRLVGVGRRFAGAEFRGAEFLVFFFFFCLFCWVVGCFFFPQFFVYCIIFIFLSGVVLGGRGFSVWLFGRGDRLVVLEWKVSEKVAEKIWS